MRSTRGTSQGGGPPVPRRLVDAKEGIASDAFDLVERPVVETSRDEIQRREHRVHDLLHLDVRKEQNQQLTTGCSLSGRGERGTLHRSAQLNRIRARGATGNIPNVAGNSPATSLRYSVHTPLSTQMRYSCYFAE